MSKNRKKIEIIGCEKVSEKNGVWHVIISWTAACAEPVGEGGRRLIRLGVLNALHRFDAADLRRLAHAAVPVEISLTFTSFTWKYHLSQGV